MDKYLVKVPRNETDDLRYCFNNGNSFSYEEVIATSWSIQEGGILIFKQGDRVVVAYNANNWYTFVNMNNRS